MFEGFAAYCHLTLLHGFKQCALHFCRRTVDFIGEHEIGENGAFLYLECFFLHAVHHCAHNVGRQKVGRELNAVVFSLYDGCQRFYCQSFSQSRHTFEQYVSV